MEMLHVHAAFCAQLDSWYMAESAQISIKGTLAVWESSLVRHRFHMLISFLLRLLIVPGDTLVAQSASVIFSTRRTYTPVRYLSMGACFSRFCMVTYFCQTAIDHVYFHEINLQNFYTSSFLYTLP